MHIKVKVKHRNWPKKCMTSCCEQDVHTGSCGSGSLNLSVMLTEPITHHLSTLKFVLNVTGSLLVGFKNSAEEV